jgi:predicted membrane-bound mannosyltransferase
MKQIKNNDVFLALTLVVIVASFISIYVIPVNIHGDGFKHAFWAETIASKGELIENAPYLLEDIREGERKYFLIPYPLTSHVILAIFHLLGGYTALKFTPIFFGVISSLFVFLILRELGNKYIGFFAGIALIVLNGYTFFMKVLPSMEIIHPCFLNFKRFPIYNTFRFNKRNNFI